MNKSELIAKIASDMGCNKACAKRFIDSVENCIIDELKAGNDVTWTGFGKFYVGDRKGRELNSVFCDGPIEIPAGKVPKFRYGQKMKNIL